MALLGCNSVTDRGIDMNVGVLQEDLLAYELKWVTPTAAGAGWKTSFDTRKLHVLATRDRQLLASRDVVPVQEWIARSGLTVEEHSSSIWIGRRQQCMGTGQPSTCPGGRRCRDACQVGAGPQQPGHA